MMLQSSTRPRLTGWRQSRTGKRVWMKHCGRRRSAGCSVRWPPNGCPRTEEWTALMACLRRPLVREKSLQPACWKKRYSTPVFYYDFYFPSSSFSLPALVPAVMCDSGGHAAWKNFFSGGLPAHTAGASAHCTVQRWGLKIQHDDCLA